MVERGAVGDGSGLDITLHVNGRDFVSTEESDDMYAAVDRSVDKLERQLKRHKDKVKRRKSQQGLGEITAAEEAPQGDDVQENDLE